MSRRRMVGVVGAALSAAVVVWLVAGVGGDTDANVSEGVEIVRVLREVPRGVSAAEAFADGSLEVVAVPADDEAARDAVRPAALVDTVASLTIPAGGILAPGAFVVPERPGSVLGARLPTAGHTALAITVDATRAVGGWLQPGDRVNLLVPGVCADESALQAMAAATEGEVRCRRARYLYQAVEVLAVGAALGPSGGPGVGDLATGPLTVVLSLPPRATQWVATFENELTLALVPTDYVPRVVDPLPSVVDRLPGEQQETLRPDCADPQAPGPEEELPACQTDGSP